MDRIEKAHAIRHMLNERGVHEYDVQIAFGMKNIDFASTQKLSSICKVLGISQGEG